MELSTEAVRQQLESLAQSDSFAQAPRLMKFLHYIVEAELAGESSRLNQYRLAIDVMDRDQTFDPATDSCVRVEAGRLRAKLREYYGTQGADDALRFELPKGRYNPDIVVAAEAGNDSPAPLLKQSIRRKGTPETTVFGNPCLLPFALVSLVGFYSRCWLSTKFQGCLVFALFSYQRR